VSGAVIMLGPVDERKRFPDRHGRRTAAS